MFLTGILKNIGAGRVTSFKELSREAGLRVSDVAPALDLLSRLGYLRVVGRDPESGCGGACRSCAAGSICPGPEAGTLAGARFWELTEKGRRCLSRI